MNNARFLFRMDDITPTMDWERFWALLRLFQRYRVKPLLGIVPDNHDHKLDRQKPHPNFWEIMNLLVERNLADIAQHGYQHILERDSAHPLLNAPESRHYQRSEFAGYSFQEQLEKIQNGREVLRSHGLLTDYFFAPNHSFDFTTLSALKSAGFTAVSDGCALRPYRARGLVFIPQQLWHPIWMPTGTFTICLHSNQITPLEIRAIRKFLRTPARISSFSQEVRSYAPLPLDSVNNSVFRGLYTGVRFMRDVVRKRSRSQTTGNARLQPLSTNPMRMEKGSISSI